MSLPNAVQALLGLSAGETSGRDTFARFRYQTKVAVYFWLTCLDADGPEAVVCEHIEDVAVVWRDRVRLYQVKTRMEKLSHWTLAVMCKDSGGLDSSARAYWLTRALRRQFSLSFHLWLQGPASGRAPTPDFINAPGSVAGQNRERVRRCAEQAIAPHLQSGEVFAEGDLCDWLRALHVEPGQPGDDLLEQQVVVALVARLSTSPVNLIWDTLTKLLERAEAAQAGATPLGDGIRQMTGSTPGRAEEQVLTRQMLMDLLPDDPALASHHLQELKSSGKLSNMERKMLLQGASKGTRSSAKARRADAEIQIQRLLAQGGSGVDRLVRLRERVVEYAFHAANAHGRVPHPAENIYNWLYLNEGLWRGSVDRDGLMAEVDHGPLGVLCDESDRCRFPWCPR